MIDIHGVFKEECSQLSFTVFILRRSGGKLTWGFVREFNSLEQALTRYPNAIFVNRNINKEYGEDCIFVPYLESDLQ